MAILNRFLKQDKGKGTVDPYLNQRVDGPVWSISYTIREQFGSTSFGIGEIDAETGRLLRLQLGYPELRPIKLGQRQNQPKELAQAVASAFVREMYAGDFNNLRLAPEGGPGPYYGLTADTYTFTWILHHNDIPVPDHWVLVSLDQETLDLVTFETSTPSLMFGDDEPAVTAEEALERLHAFEPSLVYHPIYERYGPAPAYQLVYYFRSAPVRVDAVSGEPVDYSGRPLPDPSPGAPLTADPSAAITPDKLPLTTEQAIALSQELFNVSEDMVADTSSYAPRGSNIHVHWYGPPTPDEPYRSLSATFDTTTGLLLNAYRSSERSATQAPEMTPEAKAAAIAVVQQMYGHLVDDLRLTVEPSFFPRDSYLVFFQRYLNDIPVEGNGVWVQLDPRTLEWVHLSADWTDADRLPTPGEVISAQEAKDLLLGDRGVDLVYRAVYPADAFVDRWSQAIVPARLYYEWAKVEQSGSPVTAYVHAHTGELMDLNGRPVTWQKELNERLTGHWAETELRLALSQGALNPTATNMDQPMTRHEALLLLIHLQRSYSYSDLPLPYTDVQPHTSLYEVLVRAVNAGWLKPEGEEPTFGADQEITRAEFAIWITRMLNLSELVESPLVTQSSFADLEGLTRAEQNAAAFLEALGVLEAGPAFRGNDPLTTAEGAVIFARLLSR